MHYGMAPRDQNSGCTYARFYCVQTGELIVELGALLTAVR
jgi:hypothetical protein